MPGYIKKLQYTSRERVWKNWKETGDIAAWSKMRQEFFFFVSETNIQNFEAQWQYWNR